MRRFFFVNIQGLVKSPKKGIIGIILLSAMIFVIPANAGLLEKFNKNVEGITKGVKSVLKEVQKEKEQQPSHKQKETQEPLQQPVKAQHSELVSQIQQGLNELGYKLGTPDGYMGANTRNAILKFQKDNGLQADGRADNELLSTIGKVIDQQSTIKKDSLATSTSTSTSGNDLGSSSSNVSSDAALIHSGAEDIVAPFLEYCSRKYNYCECALKKYSDKIRNGKRKKLLELENNSNKHRKVLLSSGRFTPDILDAFVRLYVSAQEHGELSRTGDRDKRLWHRDKQNELQGQLDKFVSDNNIKASGSLIKYSMSQFYATQIKKEMSEDDGSLFPKVKRELTLLSQDSNKNDKYGGFFNKVTDRFIIKECDKISQDRNAASGFPLQIGKAQHDEKLNNSELVRQIQQGLIGLGYGRMGGVLEVGDLNPDLTRNLIQMFQRDKGLEVDGKADNELLENINKFLDQQYISGGNTYTFSPSSTENASASKPSNVFSNVIATHPEAKSVYEECTSSKDFRNSVDCQCLAVKFAELRSKQGPQSNRSFLIAEICQRGCRNVQAQMRLEYEKCVLGSGFNHEGFPQEEYCKCYAETYGNLLGEFEGQIDENKKSSMRLKARTSCGRPGSYKIK